MTSCVHTGTELMSQAQIMIATTARVNDFVWFVAHGNVRLVSSPLETMWRYSLAMVAQAAIPSTIKRH